MKKSYFFKAGFMLLLTALFAVQGLVAQSLQVSGTVVDASQNPIPGVAVMEEGTTNGVVTGADGTYAITAKSASNLVFTFVGYKPVTVAVGSQKTINVTMVEDVASLDEVVVVGYGVQKKSHLTGSVASVETEGMTDVPTSSLDQMLVGKSAGLNISNSSTEAGADAQISIRGTGSLTSASSPLIIVDGFPISGGINSVNAADIQSIEILKDAASASIYGSRAAGGVILITTKGGESGKPNYNIKLTTGIVTMYKEKEINDTQDYYDQCLYEYETQVNYWEANDPSKVGSVAAGDVTWMDAQQYLMHNITGNTDWSAYGLNDAAQFHNIQASVSGGTDDIKYYISGNYAYNESTVLGSDFQKINIRAKVDAKLSDHVTVGVSMAPTYAKRTEVPVGYNSFAMSTESWFPVYHTEETVNFLKAGGLNDGNYDYNGYQQNAGGVTMNNGGNPLFSKEPGDYAQALDFANFVYPDRNGNWTLRQKSLSSSSSTSAAQKIDGTEEYRHIYAMNGNGYINVNIIDGLTFRSSNGFDLRNIIQEEFVKAGATKIGSQATGRFYNNMAIKLLSENMFTYDKTFGKHYINFLAGYTAETWSQTTSQVEGNFPSDYVQTLNAASELLKEDTYTRKQETAMQSVLARASYSYADRYLVSASVRADGSSKFGPDNRYGYFPSVSLGWRMSEESWMESATWVDQLKLRASYGVTGSDNIDNYAPYNTLSLVQLVLGGGNGQVASGYANTSSTLGNRALTWEQTNEWNGGVDFSLLNGRLSGSIDAYHSETKALLMEQAVSDITGFSSFYNNVGKIRNQGLELELSGIIMKKKDLMWDASINIATNKNTLLDAGGPDELINTETSAIILSKVGEQAIQFYGYKTDGIIQTQAELDAMAGTDMALAKKAELGGFRIVGNGDGKLNSDDYQVLGDPFPDFTWGMTHTVTYKDFDFSMVWSGSQGNDIFNSTVSSTGNLKWDKSLCAGRFVADIDGVRGNGEVPKYKLAVKSILTDYTIEDGSYAALRSLTIGYTLPQTFAKKVGMKGLRVYLSGQNLLYIWASDYRGVNPESRNYDSDEPLGIGIQSSSTPINTTLSLGLDLNF